MRFQDVSPEIDFLQVKELTTPTPTSTVNTTAPGAQTMAPGQTVQSDPQAQAKMQAQQALDRQNQRKQIQDMIRAKQQELADLQKQLAAIK